MKGLSSQSLKAVATALQLHFIREPDRVHRSAVRAYSPPAGRRCLWGDVCCCWNRGRVTRACAVRWRSVVLPDGRGEFRLGRRFDWIVVCARPDEHQAYRLDDARDRVGESDRCRCVSPRLVQYGCGAARLCNACDILKERLVEDRQSCLSLASVVAENDEGTGRIACPPRARGDEQMLVAHANVRCRRAVAVETFGIRHASAIYARPARTDAPRNRANVDVLVLAASGCRFTRDTLVSSSGDQTRRACRAGRRRAHRA